MAKEKKSSKLGCFVIISIVFIVGYYASTSTESVRPQTPAQTATKETNKTVSISEEEIKSIVTGLIRKTDEFEGVDFYSPPGFPTKPVETELYSYIGVRNNKAFLRLKAFYFSENWLFIDKLSVKVGESVLPLILGQFDRDNNNFIWEWADVSVSEDSLSVLHSMTLSDDVTLRFHGQKYHHTQKFSDREKAALDEILSVYQELKSIGM